MNVTAKGMAEVLNQVGTLYVNDLSVNVRILNVKSSYGRIRYQVVPISGDGVVWVDSNRVTNIGKEES